MQPTTDFNPLDFKKLTVEQQIAAARTMNQKDLIAAAGTAISIEELLKLQGLSDEQIQKRLVELNIYQAQLARNGQPEQHSRHEHKLTLAEFLAQQEEQNHAQTQAGHKLGNIANLSHDQQVHLLAEHFSHGGSYSDAAKALGATDAEAQEIEEFTKQAKAEIDKKYENEEQTPELEKKKKEEAARRLKEFGPGPQSIRNILAEAAIRAETAPTYDGNQKALRASEKLIPRAEMEVWNLQKKAKNGTVTEEEMNTLKNVELSKNKASQIKNQLENDKSLKTEIIRNFVKDNSSTANKVASASIVAKGGVSQDSIKQVKASEQDDSKAASAEALKTTNAVEKSDDEFGSAPNVPKLGSIKMAEWKNHKQNAETNVSAQENQVKLTV